MENQTVQQEMDKFHYVDTNIDELMAFAREKNIKVNQQKLEKEIRLMEAIKKPLDKHVDSFKGNWNFQAMNEFTKSLKLTFTNRRFKASDANSLYFYYNEHNNNVDFMIKASSGLSELSRLTVLKNMQKNLEFKMKGLNVKRYFQLRDYIQKFGHEETPVKLKRMKMDLKNIHARVDNVRDIDEVLLYEKNVKNVQKAMEDMLLKN